MFSLLQNVYSYLWAKSDQPEDVVDEEEFLAQQLLELEIESTDCKPFVDDNQTPAQSECLERTGTVTYLTESYGLIDGMLFFDRDCTMMPLNLQEKVRYLVYRNSEEETPKVLKILQSLGTLWDEEETACDEKIFTAREHVLVGQVEHRDKRVVAMKENALKFNLDAVQSSVIPVQGDWLELTCKVQWNDDSPCDVQEKEVLEVLSIKPLRVKVTKSKVTTWNGREGTCDRYIYFTKQSCQSGFDPFVGAQVIIESIESDQGSCTWRGINMVSDCELTVNNNDSAVSKVDKEHSSYELENENKLSVTKNIDFINIDFNERKSAILEIKNNSTNIYTITKWKLMSSRQSSQLIIEPYINRKVQIYPNKNLKLTVTCSPKVLGHSIEIFVLMFNGFQVKRCIHIGVVDSNMQQEHSNHRETSELYNSNYNDQINNMKKINHRKDNRQCLVAGVRPIKPPAFVPVKLGGFPIPDRMWGAVLGDSKNTVCSADYANILERIERVVPSLAAELSVGNYMDRWHALLYIEEIQQNILMRIYDMPKAFLTPSQGYLTLEIEGLSEKRPSLMRGDRVIAKEIWNSGIPDYEGYIHELRGNTIYLKFNPQFQDCYTGYDVALEFHFSRSVYRRCHQSINLAIAHLGPDILFPSRILKSTPQLSKIKFESMSWFNEDLNEGQKEAVRNVVKGVCRPMPYCIFGPPGTGKTITVVETVLQILELIPDSRILIATPSNSAANLVTERLLKYKDRISGSLVRLIAHYLVDSETLPEEIKPYCATLDITRENTAKSKYMQNEKGVNLLCRASFVGRHRVTVGTCSCLGTLAQMELPRGHFTHVIVDEAGQATEPEIMIPMTFIDKDSGQIVLAGDPLQLGPVVVCKYAQNLGFEQSYLERLLERFPYQKDCDSFKERGYDERLITQLTFNYRSVAEVITLPSALFYDSSLVPQMNGEEDWVKTLLKDIAPILPGCVKGSSKGGVFVYGVKGSNMRAVDSPSWFNPQEATMLLFYTNKLYKKNVVPDQIGIITPYIAQIRYLRKLFDSTGTPLPKIGTVEEFQGQERHIVLLSTVRSSEDLLQDDYKFALGFVKSPKRLNVALTRAQVAVVLFGDPHLLSRDVLWCKVISHAVRQGQYTGCNLPECLQRPENEDS